MRLANLSSILVVAYLVVLLPSKASGGADDGKIVIEDFRHPQHMWIAVNDPLMGGRSTGSVSMADGVCIFDGEVEEVPSLGAPGFITMTARHGDYPDVSTCAALTLVLRAAGAEYHGYRISFGTVHVPGGRYAFGYKANFDPSVGEAFQEIVIPFEDFTAKWDDETGDPIVTCQQDHRYCPTAESLRDFQTMSIWGEGVAGRVHLEIQSIGATGCAASTGDEQAGGDDPLLVSVVDGGVVGESKNEIAIESFNAPVLTWREMNDPVMGGESTGTFSVNENGLGEFDGDVVDVPFLHAPGFIKVDGTGPFPDVSACNSLKLVVMAHSEYAGYRVSFGFKRPPHAFKYIHGFKANFDVPVGDGSFREVVIPFSDFSDNWDPATGDQIVTCRENPDFCPDADTLRNMREISLWGEGVAGKVHLLVRSISAIGCSSSSSSPREALRGASVD